MRKNKPGKLGSYPLSTVPPKSPHRQFKHQPAGSPGRHRSLDHHSTLQSVCVRGRVSMCVSVGGGCPRRAVQPGSLGSRELSAWVCTRKEVCDVDSAAPPRWSYVPLSASISLCVKTLPILLLSATLHSVAHEVNECVREGARFVSPLSSPALFSGSGSSPALPPTLTSFSWGLNQVTGLM